MYCMCLRKAKQEMCLFVDDGCIEEKEGWEERS